MIRIGSIVLRVDDLQRQTEFWEAALGYVRRDSGESDDFVLLGPPDGAPEVWSVYGAERSQPVATGGRWDDLESGSDTRKPLPWVATSCPDPKMVRRGSTVRVRQRASQKASKWPFLLPRSSTCIARGSLNLSPRSVPSFGLVTDSRLEQTALGAQSTSVVGRGLSDRHGPLAVALGFDRCLTRPGQRS
jgi:hypothetical protein